MRVPYPERVLPSRDVTAIDSTLEVDETIRAG